VILCGGRSVRMGVDKATITVDGSTLLERSLARLDEVCDPVLIAGGDAPRSITGRRSVVDAMPGAGPLIAVVAVDLPWIDPRLLSLLAERIGDCDVAVCETVHGLEPLHAVYSTSILGAAETALAGDDRSLRHLIERSRAARLREVEWRDLGISDGFTRNINTAADLAEVSRMPPPR
jgi:molybdopterin-guanine dinucleotide biosynthesis protein A